MEKCESLRNETEGTGDIRRGDKDKETGTGSRPGAEEREVERPVGTNER